MDSNTSTNAVLTSDQLASTSIPIDETSFKKLLASHEDRIQTMTNMLVLQSQLNKRMQAQLDYNFEQMEAFRRNSDREIFELRTVMEQNQLDLRKKIMFLESALKGNQNQEIATKSKSRSVSSFANEYRRNSPANIQGQRNLGSVDEIVVTDSEDDEDYDCETPRQEIKGQSQGQRQSQIRLASREVHRELLNGAFALGAPLPRLGRRDYEEDDEDDDDYDLKYYRKGQLQNAPDDTLLFLNESPPRFLRSGVSAETGIDCDDVESLISSSTGEPDFWPCGGSPVPAPGSYYCRYNEFSDTPSKSISTPSKRKLMARFGLPGLIKKFEKIMPSSPKMKEMKNET